MKKLFVFIQGLLAYLFLPVPAFAVIVADPCPVSLPAGILKTLCGLQTDRENTLRNIIIMLIVVAVVIALIFLIIGGIRWITSRGDKEQVESARNNVIAAIVGLVVVFIAIFIISLIFLAFGLSFADLKIPSLQEKL